MDPKFSLSRYATELMCTHRAAPDDQAVVNSILMVGAVRSLHEKDRLYPADDRYLETALRLAVVEYGLHFGENPEVKICGLPRTDFLMDEEKARTHLSAYPMQTNLSERGSMSMDADMVIFCKVFYSTSGAHQNKVIDRNTCRQSPHADVPGAWSKALERANAKWAFNVHKNEIELPTDFLAIDPYQAVQSQKLGEFHFDFVTHKHAPRKMTAQTSLRA